MFELFNPYKRGCFIETGDLQSGAGDTPPEGIATPPEDTGDDVETTETETTETTQTTASAKEGDKKRTSKQPPDVDTAFANMRREAEQAKRELEARDRWVADTFGQHGIKTWDDYQKAVHDQLKQQQEATRQQQEQQLRELGYDPEVLRQVLKNDPEFQEVKQQNQLLKKQMEEQGLQQRVKSEFEELRSAYPELIKVPQDIDDTTKARWQKGGVSLLEAYDLTNKAQIGKAAKQAVLNNLNSKSHLKTEGAGDGDLDVISIDPDELKGFRSMFPGRKDGDFAYFKKHGKLPKGK